jgi:hypothetical protein
MAAAGLPVVEHLRFVCWVSNMLVARTNVLPQASGPQQRDGHQYGSATVCASLMPGDINRHMHTTIHVINGCGWCISFASLILQQSPLTSSFLCIF